MEKYLLTDNFPFSIINFQLFSDSYRIHNHRLCDRGHHNRFHSRRIRKHYFINLPTNTVTIE